MYRQSAGIIPPWPGEFSRRFSVQHEYDFSPSPALVQGLPDHGVNFTGRTFIQPAVSEITPAGDAKAACGQSKDKNQKNNEMTIRARPYKPPGSYTIDGTARKTPQKRTKHHLPKDRRYPDLLCIIKHFCITSQCETTGKPTLFGRFLIITCMNLYLLFENH